MQLNEEERKLVNELNISEERLLNGGFEEYNILMDTLISMNNVKHYKETKKKKVLNALINKLS